MSSRSALIHPYSSRKFANSITSNPRAPMSIRMRPRINQVLYDRMFKNIVLEPVKTIEVKVSKKELKS
jgi:hypothetical protein